LSNCPVRRGKLWTTSSDRRPQEAKSIEYLNTGVELQVLEHPSTERCATWMTRQVAVQAFLRQDPDRQRPMAPNAPIVGALLNPASPASSFGKGEIVGVSRGSVL
jgi:hypothetical protein